MNDSILMTDTSRTRAHRANRRAARDMRTARRAAARTIHTAGVDATRLPARLRWQRALSALGRVLLDPQQTDQVLVFAMYANAGSMPRRVHRFYDDPRGRLLYTQRRTIDAHAVDFAKLRALPVGTLGHAYVTFLDARGLTPEVFESPPEEIHDPAMAYVIQRLRQTHDLWHVVTGLDTDPASEVALQGFTFAQVRAPSALILAVLGTVRGTRWKPRLARDVRRAFRAGRRAEKLAVFPWEDHWATSLDEVRAMLGIEPLVAS